ncbi:MAG: hypothetical protein M1133_15440 [Armatimonadetes bacterium]|nr:hypothetical protein [Armatimonadota bacterium]
MLDSSRKRTMCLATAILFGAIVFLTTWPAFGQDSANSRQRYRPVTLTQENWRSPIGQNLMYSRWRYAFNNFSFYGHVRRNWLYVGGARTMAVEGSRSGLTNLIRFLPRTGPSGPLVFTQDFRIPAPLQSQGGALAGEVIALTMNVAFNDVRVMPRHPGYDLEKFIVRFGLFKGRTVGQVLDMADRVLGGEPPLRYGIANYEVLADAVRAINANYEFRDYATYIDRGFLQPNRGFGLPDPPHDPHVP